MAGCRSYNWLKNGTIRDWIFIENRPKFRTNLTPFYAATEYLIHAFGCD
jgi:hypothetical protein